MALFKCLQAFLTLLAFEVKLKAVISVINRVAMKAIILIVKSSTVPANALMKREDAIAKKP